MQEGARADGSCVGRKWNIAACLLWLSLMVSGCGNDAADPFTTPLPAGLQVEDLHVGSGSHPVLGQTLTVAYTLFLADGTQVESTVQRGRDFSWRLGSGGVIPGLESGVMTMNVGGHRKITIPPSLAYGAAGSPPSIPPDATLVYDLWLSGAR